MTGNENFPDAGSLLDELKDLSNRYFDALLAVSPRDTEKVYFKNNLRSHLIRALKQLGLYVTLIAKGSQTALKLSYS